MKLFLMQHGDALSKQDNAERPLSVKGKDDIQRVANFISSANIDFDRIFHSGKTRSEQTAAIVSSRLNASGKPEQLDFINPNDDVEGVLAQLPQDAGRIMVVGHLPFLARLVAHLSANDSSKSVVSYQPGSLVCLESDDGGDWNICWMVRPELL